MNKTTHSNGLEIAVVGMALRLPTVDDPEAFFRILCNGEELIRPIEDAVLRRQGVTDAELADPHYVKAAGYLDRRFDFDAGFFDYKPREAEYMDPQLRMLHECCFAALQSAGCDPRLDGPPIGLYIGASQNMHWLRAVSQHVSDKLGEVYDLKMLYMREFFATRIAYRLNLKGPALGLDTTCSTSLVAVHMAAQGLLSGDCDVALAGGACVSPLLKGYLYHEGMIQSQDGHCRPFDAQAHGTVPGQGVGVVALKRLDDAIADGNPIHAVLKASAINNDGEDKVGYTAPSVSGQTRVIRAALELAEVQADTIDFVECHGTATRIGDPIEVQALTQAYVGREEAKLDGQCLIGSVKSNVGHLDTASGITGFIKAVMAIKHGRLPPSLHYAEPNPMIDFSCGRFAVNADLTPLQNEDRPLRAGVSSFGIGGTNVHAIVEEYVERRTPVGDSGRPRLIPLSAKTPGALQRYAQVLQRALDVENPSTVDAVAMTLQRSRLHEPMRAGLVAATHRQLTEQLKELASGGAVKATNRDLVFLFSGQGTQYPGMTGDLYRHVRQYREHVDACLAQLPETVRTRVHALLTGEASEGAENMAADTEIAQPFLFVVEYALAATLIAWGVRPAEMIGHSLGEYVAACLADVFTLPDALTLVCERGRLMAGAEAGGMLSVRLPETRVREYLNDMWGGATTHGPELAAVNSSALVAVAGTHEDIERLEQRLVADGVRCTRLKTSHAYHSRMMDEVITSFRAAVEATPRRAPRMRYRSNVTGALVTAKQAIDPDYWCRHLRQTVRFLDAVTDLVRGGRHAFVEIGPGNTLITFVAHHEAFDDDSLCVQSVRHPRDASLDEAVLMRAVGRLYADGADLEWQELSDGLIGPLEALPTYAFEHATYDQIVGDGTAPVAEQSQTAVKQEIRHTRPALQSDFIEARNETERALCELWSDIFKLDRIGIDDDFFELGGHSLLATRLLGEVRENFGAEVSLNALFEQPHVRGLAEQLETTRTNDHRMPALVAVDRGGPIPVSFQQRRLWLIDQLDGSAQYNMPSPFILHGELDRGVLQHALDTLVERHESLRTVFHEVDGEPMQAIRPPQSVDMRWIDLSGQSEQERERSIRELVKEDAQHPFDLAKDLPLRITLVLLAPAKHLLLFNVHHIVSDGWSEVLLVKEFAELYQAKKACRAPSLQTLSLQYGDYAVWQRSWLSGEVLAQELAYWRSRLEGISPVHNLPLDRPRPRMPAYQGAVCRRKLPLALLQQLRSLGQSRGATLFMTLQSAFALLLARWSNSEDIVMGSPVAGRQHKALESLIGFFVNTLLLRTHLSGNPGFFQLLERTKKSVLSAFEHQHLPFEMLVDELVPVRSHRHAPLFQIMFALQNYERGSFALEGLELERVEQTVSARFDISLITAESDDGLFTDWHYDTQLFDEDTIERMAEQFETLLSAVVQAPETPVLELEMLPDAERRRVLQEWQLHEPVQSAPQRVETLFEEYARMRPNAPALVYGEQMLTYRELNVRAERLSRQLKAAGVRTGCLVALYLSNGIEAIVAMLAALKRGAAYVPMDPTYPASRLNAMLCVARPAAMVVGGSGSVPDELSIPEPTKILDIAAASPVSPVAEVGTEDEHQPSVDDPAYVIFTSGSSGTPKGVVISHRQLHAMLTCRTRIYEKALSSTLLLNSISFDSSVPSIYGALMVGGQLVLCSEEERRDPDAIVAMIERFQIGHILCLPSLYGALLDVLETRSHAVECMNAVVLAGEALPVALRERHFAHPAIRAALYNEYGPTECSVMSAIHRCQPTTQDAMVPIGRSPGHARLYVLNAAGKPVPIGAEGELYIGGDGVGVGYLGQPELSAKCFIPDPFAATPNARMYRSGDRVRWRRDGELEILGRIDNQVKLRGYRVELGEIDSVLKTFTGVSHAVSRVVDDRLVAYVCPGEGVHAEDALNVSAIKAFVAGRLPDFMVPQIVMVIERMPRLPNGKVDDARLPAPQGNQDRSDRKPPRNAIEQQILDAWCEVLKIAPPSIDEDFFAVGGDSILLLKLRSVLGRAGLKFPIKNFHDEPTIEATARLIEAVEPRDQDDQPSRGAQRLHPIQSWFLQGDGTDLHHFNQSVLLNVDATFDFRHAEAVLAALYARHDALRLRFYRTPEDEWRAEYRDLSQIDYAESLIEVAIRGEDGSDLAEAIERETGAIQQQLSLEGPLLKLARLGLPDGSRRLFIVVHHLVVDGVSWRVLLQDFETAYRQAADGRDIRLPPRPVSFQNAVERLAEKAREPSVTAELSHWQAVLAERIDTLRPVSDTGDRIADEATRTVRFSSELTAELLAAGRHVYRTNVEEVLLAALRKAMHAWRAPRALGLLLEAHGRTALEASLDVSETVGWFTASYPVVFPGLDCSDETDPGALLRDTKERLRHIPHKGNHYGVLKYLSDCGEALDDATFQREAIRFNYLGQFDQTVHRESLFGSAEERCGSNISPRRYRDALLALDGLVVGGQLRFSLKYNRSHFDSDAIDALIDAYCEAVEMLVAHGAALTESRMTPSDVPLLDVDQDELSGWQERWPAMCDAYPATAAQQVMLVRSMRDGDRQGSSFINQLIFDIRGDLELDRLRAAWEALPERHDIFRTVFVPMRRGGVAQVLLVRGQVKLPFAWIDASDQTQTRQRSMIETAIAADRGISFDPAVAPLSRVTVWRLGRDRHRVLWTTHHALVDGWSIPLAFRSLLDGYAGGHVPDTSPEPGDFGDYVKWSHARDRTANRAYWREYLSRAESPTVLKTGVRASGVSRPASTFASLHGDTVVRLERLARSTGVTLYTTIQAAWAYLLHLYTGQSTVCFGSVTSGRPAELPGVESTVGLFINTLPVVLTIEDDVPLQHWLKCIHDAQRRSQEHEILPLVDILALTAGGARNELFNTSLVYENYPIDSIRSQEGETALRITDLRSEESTGSGLALVLMPEAASDGDVAGVSSLRLKLMYQEGEFETTYCERLLQRFADLLQTMSSHPEASVGDLADGLQGTGEAPTGSRLPSTADLDDEQLLALLDELEADTPS